MHVIIHWSRLKDLGFFLLLQIVAQATIWSRKDCFTLFQRPSFASQLFFFFGVGATEDPKRRMRQLKGKPKKETSKDKKERKQAMQEARQQITTVVLPTMAVVVLLIVVFVYVATRPNATEWCNFLNSLTSGINTRSIERAKKPFLPISLFLIVLYKGAICSLLLRVLRFLFWNVT